MKKIIGFFLMAFFATGITHGADKNTTVIVKQLTESDRSSLPDKTIEVKLQRMRAADKGYNTLVETIVQQLNFLREEDLNNDVYQVTLSPTADGNIDICINSVNDLAGVDVEKGFYGIIMGATHKPCLIVKTDANQPLLKQAFKKADGKQTVVQEFEIVEEIIHRDAALDHGLWNPTTHEFTPIALNINGTDYTSNE